MSGYDSEAALVADLCAAVPALWPDAVGWRTEVRCHPQASMDLLVRTPDTLIAVEAKLSDWNRVVAQAFLHKWCADFRFVAVPQARITQARLDDAARWGIGVVSVTADASRIVLDAERSEPGAESRSRLAALCEP